MIRSAKPYLLFAVLSIACRASRARRVAQVDGLRRNGLLALATLTLMPQVYAQSGEPIAYTEVIQTTGAPQNCTVRGPIPSGDLGIVGIGSVRGDYILRFHMVGNTANVVSYSVPRIDLNGANGWQNVAGPNDRASVSVSDTSIPENIRAQGNFLPSAGIFVSIDNTNGGIGFGSSGQAGTPPPAQILSENVVYPFAVRAILVPTYNLKTDFQTSGNAVIGTSCINFPALSCGIPPNLFTTGGPLSLTPGEVCTSGISQAVKFSAHTTFYTLSLSQASPPQIYPGLPPSQATVSVTITPIGGYSGNISLQCNVTEMGYGYPLPAAPRCTFGTTQVAVNGATASSTLNIEASNQTSLGTYVIAVTGTDTGGQDPGDGAQTVQVSVLPPPWWKFVRNPLVGAITIIVGLVTAGFVIRILRSRKRSLP